MVCDAVEVLVSHVETLFKEVKSPTEAKNKISTYLNHYHVSNNKLLTRALTPGTRSCARLMLIVNALNLKGH